MVHSSPGAFLGTPGGLGAYVESRVPFNSSTVNAPNRGLKELQWYQDAGSDGERPLTCSVLGGCRCGRV